MPSTTSLVRSSPNPCSSGTEASAPFRAGLRRARFDKLRRVAALRPVAVVYLMSCRTGFESRLRYFDLGLCRSDSQNRCLRLPRRTP